MQKRPKLRDNKNSKIYELYPLGRIPDEVIVNIGKWMIYNYTVGKQDIDGQDWGDIFAKSIDGIHLNSPVGLADVLKDNMAWSVKSVKHERPHLLKKARVISGRCSPDYSYGISDPHQDINKTGEAILSIWNERINIAKERFEPLRSSLLIRNPQKLEFTLFEHELHRYNIKDFIWEVNKQKNLQGINVETGEHTFTWQPHGSQFTIIYNIPRSAKRFMLKSPPILDFQRIMQEIGFDDSWVNILTETDN